MEKQYKPEKFEEKIYQKWEKSEAFQPAKKGKPYTIIMPPPNANDPLHIGHAMFVTIEDILIRYHRMLGKAALWLPGTDHAGIETQYVFEKHLKKLGKSRFDYDRETLFKMIFDYVKKNSGVAVKQMKKIGASADWTKIKFSLDKEIVELVLDTFIELYKDGLVYRDLQLVNYCTSCGTAFSNLEVKYKQRKQPLYYMKYGPFVLATVRPETKFGDTGVAINPKDKRYKKWIGKTVEVKGLLGSFKLKVVADKSVDLDFGTGVVKITPAHDFDDFKIGKKHNLEIKQVIGFDGRLNKNTGRYKGLTVNQARKKIVEDLEKKGLLLKTDNDYVHRVGTCYRCGKVVEPLPLPQFFIKVKPLVKPVLKALADKKVKIYGSGHKKILIHWLKNLKDWNISRQIVWGIKIPVWYCIKNKALKTDLNQCFVVNKEKPKKCKKCGATEFKKETDTFDTWFSSAQWPWITLKTDTDKTMFDRFYPTEVMETGYDILPFWVMRMLLMGIYKTGKVPFKKVYLHGLIRDEKGQKMSKSKGNVLDPIEVVNKYGADALRMALVISSTAGNDKAVGEGAIKGMRNLTNKIWNASRYVNQFLEDQGKGEKDNQFNKKLNKTMKEISQQLDDLKIGLAAETVYNRFWHWFCDECIEEAKKGKISKKALTNGLRVFLKLLHPFVPFVTEAVWQELPETNEKMLIKAKWPISSGPRNART